MRCGCWVRTCAFSEPCMNHDMLGACRGNSHSQDIRGQLKCYWSEGDCLLLGLASRLTPHAPRPTHHAFAVTLLASRSTDCSRTMMSRRAELTNRYWGLLGDKWGGTVQQGPVCGPITFRFGGYKSPPGISSRRVAQGHRSPHCCPTQAFLIIAYETPDSDITQQCSEMVAVEGDWLGSRAPKQVGWDPPLA